MLIVYVSYAVYWFLVYIYIYFWLVKSKNELHTNSKNFTHIKNEKIKFDNQNDKKKKHSQLFKTVNLNLGV